MFLQNTAPGVVERLGLDGATLRADHPNLIVANISGYGTAGPKRDRKAYDMLVQAESGMVAVTGTADHPVKTGVPTADIAAGLYAAMSAYRRCCGASAPARAPRSTSRCSTRPSSGWATRCTCRSTPTSRCRGWA